MAVKNSATEEEVGKLHKLLSDANNLKGRLMLEVALEFVEIGLREEAISILNSRDLSAMQKWVEYNKVSCLGAEDDETTPLAKSLAKLKEVQAGKIVDMQDVKEAMING